MIKKALAVILAGVFLLADQRCPEFCHPDPEPKAKGKDLIESGSSSLLAPPLGSKSDTLKVRFLAGEILLSHKRYNEYIAKKIEEIGYDKLDKKLEKIKGVDTEAELIAIPGLLKFTGLPAHVGLGRYYGRPVIYIDSGLYPNEDVRQHEFDEVSGWEGLRKSLGLEPAEMRGWIMQNIDTPVSDERLEGTEYHNKTTQNIAEIIHNNAHQIPRRLYGRFSDKVDYEYLVMLLTLYGDEVSEEKDVVIAARKDKADILKLGSDEIVCSVSGVRGHFIGNQYDIVAAIKYKFSLPDPASYEHAKIVRGEGDKKVTFFKRMAGSVYVWTFKEADKTKVADICKLNLKTGLIPELGPDEIACSVSGGEGHFIGSSKDINAAIKTKFDLPDPLSYGQAEIVRGKGDRKIEFFKRMSGTRRIWAFKEVDKKKVAKECNLTLRVETDILIEELQLSDAIALLGSDPLRLRQWLMIYHPELLQEDVDRITIHAIKGLGGRWEDDVELHAGYEEDLAPPPVPVVPRATDNHCFVLSGKLGKGAAPFLQLTGAYTRKITVSQDGAFSATVPLPKTGEVNEFQLYSFDPKTLRKSPAVDFSILQTSEKEDAEEAFLRLIALREETLDAIKKNPARYNFLLRCMEQGLLKRFTYSKKDGFSYLKSMIRAEKSSAKRSLMEAILAKFEEI